ncbi:hypothetical protein N779_07455 [Vibrio coralliilyticus OCN008]|nr:hypothetical protein N779_07455 [Vibrio coralliilyticus OCN008]
MFRMNKIATTLACIVLSGSLYAAEPYDSTKAYSGAHKSQLMGRHMKPSGGLTLGKAQRTSIQMNGIRRGN